MKNNKGTENRTLQELVPRDIRPLWPLPLKKFKDSEDRLKAEFQRHALWHYSYQFEGEISFPARHNEPRSSTNNPRRHLQRFQHIMPWLVDAAGGSLQGKRILDIGCNSGFWSLQCAALGADVVGFDARRSMIEQAEFLQEVTEIKGARFEVMNYHEMNAETLGGSFDIVLNLGILYHLACPVQALQLSKDICNDILVIDTELHPSKEPIVRFEWEEPFDIRARASAGLVATPTATSLELILEHIAVADFRRIPITSTDLPSSYLKQTRGTWIAKMN